MAAHYTHPSRRQMKFSGNQLHDALIRHVPFRLLPYRDREMRFGKPGAFLPFRPSADFRVDVHDTGMIQSLP